MRTAYVSGKISDESNEKIVENIEFARKHALEIWKLNNDGYSVGVFCPHTNDYGAHLEGIDYETLIQYDLMQVAFADAIYMLPNWEDSPGAKRELEHAQKLNKKVLYSITEAREWLQEEENALHQQRRAEGLRQVNQ